MKSFAIVIVCYNRLAGIKRLLKSLDNVDYCGREDITLIFSIDNSGSSQVVDFANDYNWKYGEKIIRTFPRRQGLRKHILQCGDYTNDYDYVAVLEDDIYVGDCFYAYAYSAAEFYEKDEHIAGISLYAFEKNWLDWTMRFEPQRTKYDTYFLQVAQSWGQVWTKSKWGLFKEWYIANVDFKYDEAIPEYLFTWPESSWLKYHTRYCIEMDKYFVYPYTSISTNFSDAGEHNSRTVNDHQVQLLSQKREFAFPTFNENAVVYDEYCNRCNMGSFVGINNNELTVDFWGNKPKCLYKQYLLSSRILPYKIIDSYGLSLRPIEKCVIDKIKGSDIFLYDTQEESQNKNTNKRFDLLCYSIRTHNYKDAIYYTSRLIIAELKRAFSSKILMLMKRRGR